MTELGNTDKQEVGHWANNRVENGHLPFTRRERATLRFRQMRSLQKFASVHANVHNHFNLERHLIDREACKIRRSAALASWGRSAEIPFEEPNSKHLNLFYNSIKVEDLMTVPDTGRGRIL